MKIYLASPFFNEDEIEKVERAENILRNRGIEVFSPREHEVRDAQVGTNAWSEQIFELDRRGIEECDMMVMLYYGTYSDTGTAWECGYAYGKGIQVVVVQLGENSNLMVHEGSSTNITIEELKTIDFENFSKKKYVGEMF